MRAFHPFPRPLLAGRRSYRHPPPPPIVGHPRSLTPPISTASCHPSTLSLRSYAKASASNLPPVTVRTATTLTGQPLDRATFDNMLRRRMFYTPSFEIYGGVSGLFDYGPPGCALQQGIIDVWRKHFVLEEGMLEVDCSVLTPAEVLVTSGHVAKFADAMCKDPENGELFRADHFIRDALERRLDGNKKARGQQIEKKEEDPDTRHDKKVTIIPRVLPNAEVKEYQEILAKLDNYNTKELGELIRLHNLKNPATRAQPLPPVDFNLMFSTRIGPNNHLRGYLRPETAQGQLLNFSKLLNFNQQRMPFASASIGKSYRNEISPRSGLLRVREFLMAEIEHFVDPQGGKKHPRFNDVKDVELVLLNKKTQLSGEAQAQKVTIGEAVADGTVDNETLGYFLARIQLFLEKIGMDQTKIRFRQHLANEMAHYAVDCWDAELLTSYGWIECVGCADRSAYDLSVHAKKTGASLTVRQQLTEPMEVTEWEIELYRKKFGPHFQKDGRAVEAALVATTQSEREELAKDLRSNGSFTIKVDGVGDGTVTIHEELVGILQKTRAENVREFIPNIIEPSFGIGRILYALMEHCYWHRGIEKDDNGEDRGVLSFPPIVAPTKVVILPLSNNYAFRPFCHELSQKLGKLGISNRIDDSKASIGKRYSRNDELGTPLGITIDFQTAQDRTFTLRDRDSTKQVRADEDGILAAICSIVYGNKTFRDIECELPTFLAQQL